MKRYHDVFEAVNKIEYTIEEIDGKIILRSLSVNVKQDTMPEEKFFSKITSEERNEVYQWMKNQEIKTYKERAFFKLLEEALTKIRYEYYISNIEPSVDESTGKIILDENRPVAVGYSCNHLKEMCEAYNPKRFSRMTNLYELIIWYAYRIVKGYWTLNFVTNDSFGGNYSNVPNATHCLENTGARICGGYKDGVGNTYKIVTFKNGFAGVGCCYKGESNKYPVSDVAYNGQATIAQKNGTTHITLLGR